MTRVRQRSVSSPSRTCRREIIYWYPTCDNPNGSNYDSVEETYNTYTREEWMQDVVTPQFQKLSRQGCIINNPMTRIVTEAVDLPTHVELAHRHETLDVSCTPDKVLTYKDELRGAYSTRYLMELNGVSQLGLPQMNFNSVNDAAISEAWANVSNSELLSGATLAEMSKTSTSMIRILRRLLRILRKAKKLRFAALTKEFRPKELSQMWMELRYSLRPVAYDTKGVVRALKRLSESDEGFRQTFRGYAASSANSDSDEVVYPFGNLHQAGSLTYRRNVAATYSARAGVLTHIFDPHVNTFGQYDLLETAWELIPYSFIVDWIVNVGDFVASWTPNPGIRPLSSWLMKQLTINQFCSVRVSNVECVWSVPDCTNLTMEYTGGSYTIKTIMWERSPNPQLPTSPSFNVKFDWKKVIDLLIICKRLRG